VLIAAVKGRICSIMVRQYLENHLRELRLRDKKTKTFSLVLVLIWKNKRSFDVAM